MLTIIQITDLHWYAEPHRCMRGADVDANLMAVLSHIRQQHGLPDALLVTGDLVHDEAAAYARLQSVLHDFGVPAYCLPGNHDVPQTMRTQFSTGTLQWQREIILGGWQIVMLNSYVPNSASGYLADTELDALEHHLAIDPQRPALVAVHHHPIPTGIDWMDALMLENAEALFAVLDRYPQVRGLIWGHVHQSMTSQRGPIKLLGTPATSFQFVADQGTADPETTWPGYRWLQLSQDGQLHSGVERVPPSATEHTTSPPPAKSGAEMTIDILNELGVEYIFGHTGGAIIPLHAALNARMLQGQTVPRFVLCRQEGAAGHAAEGYARASGRTGVALVTSGPGATNLVTPIADAHKDSVPCVFITGQVPSAMLGKDAFQEVDMVGITRSISKHNYLVKDTAELPGVLRQAFFIAGSGRPGPVVVDICKDALIGQSLSYQEPRRLRGYRPRVSMNRSAADRLLAALLNAKRPVILAGGGVISAEAGQELRRFVDRHQLPVSLTFMGLGAIPHDHPLFLGMPGMHGTVAANGALREADFILTIGARFDDRVAVSGFGQGIDLAHVDIDATEINKMVPVRYALRANARDFLAYANQTDQARKVGADWLNKLHIWQRDCAPQYQSGGHFIKPQQFIEALSELTRQTSLVVTGVGQHQMWAALFYNYQQPRQWISSGGLGTMGFGLPAAMGAYYARPDKTVLCIDGDGSFQMNLQELATIAANRIPVKVFILNNGFLGMVRQWEDMFNQGHHYETCLARTADCDPACIDSRECRIPNPNYLNLNKVFPGIETVRITRPEDVQSGIERALAYPGPCVVDVWVERTEDVRPMISPGGSLADSIHTIE